MNKIKEFKKLILTTLLALLCVLSFFACKDNAQAVQLATPSNLQISGATLTWDEVENASGYSVQIDENAPITGLHNPRIH